jgi:alginate O-acetyltransferase complex protein AlgI
VQIYCDFSGYSDIARGLARVLGFHVPLNFRAPYLSGSIITFWRRWHISLSLWLRDYLYIPLGGNRRGRLRTLINALITWILGGLWHGAAWQFIVWGLWHGLLVGVAQTLRGTRTGGMYRRMFFPAQVLLTFVLVTIGWVFFRAPDLTTGVTMLGAMAGLPGISGPQPADPLALYALALLGVVAMCHVALYRQLDRIEAQGLVLQRVSVPARIGLISLSTFIIILFSGPTQTFIYFQF